MYVKLEILVWKQPQGSAGLQNKKPGNRSMVSPVY
jgi:hypothetical protein